MFIIVDPQFWHDTCKSTTWFLYYRYSKVFVWSGILFITTNLCFQYNLMAKPNYIFSPQALTADNILFYVKSINISYIYMKPKNTKRFFVKWNAHHRLLVTIKATSGSFFRGSFRLVRVNIMIDRQIVVSQLLRQNVLLHP